MLTLFRAYTQAQQQHRQQPVTQQQMQAMASKLQGSYSHVLVYEQQEVQDKARAVIPAEVKALSGREQVMLL